MGRKGTIIDEKIIGLGVQVRHTHQELFKELFKQHEEIDAAIVKHRPDTSKHTASEYYEGQIDDEIVEKLEKFRGFTENLCSKCKHALIVFEDVRSNELAALAELMKSKKAKTEIRELADCYADFKKEQLGEIEGRGNRILGEIEKLKEADYSFVGFMLSSIVMELSTTILTNVLTNIYRICCMEIPAEMIRISDGKLKKHFDALKENAEKMRKKGMNPLEIAEIFDVST